MTVATLTAQEASAKTIARPHGAPFTKLNAVITQSNANETATAANTAAVAVTADSLTDAIIAVADASGGATAAALTVQVLATKTVVAKIVVADSEYGGSNDANANVTFATATVGTILASGSGWAVIKTDATGAFACTASNAVDETAYFSVADSDGGVDVLGDGICVRSCVPDDATWAA